MRAVQPMSHLVLNLLMVLIDFKYILGVLAFLYIVCVFVSPYGHIIDYMTYRLSFLL